MQELLIADKYMRDVGLGIKTSTVRMGVRAIDFGDLRLKAVSGSESTVVDVVRIEVMKVRDLSEIDAAEDGFESLAGLIIALIEFYPDMLDDSDITKISWR